ncbi:MAG: MATE family efflux transporter [Eubacteriales bacterium]|nr:MATE family efflux transporter [Eubacteriales bacterium]
MEKNLTTGSVFRNIAIFSLPYLLSYFLQTLYGMADLFIIGQYEGVASTTAVSVGSQTMHMLTVMIVGLAMGTTVSIGRAVGSGDSRRAARCTGNTVTLFTLLSVALTAALLLLVKPIVAVMSTPEEAVAGTINYLTICFAGIPFITAYNIISSVFRGMGDSKSPLYFIAVACVANIGLDYLFIGVFRLGPAGAALATTLSQAISVIVSLAVIVKRRAICLTRADLRPDKSAMGEILRIGIPVAVQDGLIQIAFMVITIIANRRGINDAAAVGIVEKIIGFVFLVPSTLLSTVSALGAQNIGAGKPRRAVRTLRYAVMLAAGFGLVVSCVMQFAAESVVTLFTDAAAEGGADVIRLGGQYLRGYIWDCLFAGIHFSFSGYFCACGKSSLSFMHNIISLVLVRVPGVYLTSLRFPDTLLPMGFASTAGSILSTAICAVAFAVILRRSRTASAKGEL